MPNRQKHEEQAERNRKVVDLLMQDGTFPEWAVTALLHEDLHHVDSFFADKLQSHPSSHVDRQNFVRSFLKTIHTDYRELQDQSNIARYHCIRISTSELGDATIRRDSIRDEVKKKLA